MSSISNPQVMTGVEVSDRIFTSTEECADFVNTIAEDDVVKDNRFRFSSVDGVIFTGGCMTPMEYEIYKEDLTNPPKSA